MLQVKIWFQNRRTKWKKQDNISNSEAAEHKTTTTTATTTTATIVGSSNSQKSCSDSKQSFRDSPSPISSPSAQATATSYSKPIGSKAIAAELNAKLTAKHNTKMKGKQPPTSTAKSDKLDVVVDMSVKSSKASADSSGKGDSVLEGNYRTRSVQVMEHDVETRLSASKISVNPFKNSGGAITMQPSVVSVSMHRLNADGALQRHSNVIQ